MKTQTQTFRHPDGRVGQEVAHWREVNPMEEEYEKIAPELRGLPHFVVERYDFSIDGKEVTLKEFQAFFKGIPRNPTLIS